LLCCFRQEVSVNVGLAPFFCGFAESFTSFVVYVLTLSRWLGCECEGEDGTNEYPVFRSGLTGHELSSRIILEARHQPHPLAQIGENKAYPQGETTGKWDEPFLR
jgi:hypothetical protein